MKKYKFMAYINLPAKGKRLEVSENGTCDFCQEPAGGIIGKLAYAKQATKSTKMLDLDKHKYEYRSPLWSKSGIFVDAKLPDYQQVATGEYINEILQPLICFDCVTYLAKEIKKIKL